MLRQAHIKVWVLTGDKIETAINIGYSCALLDNEIEQYIIDADESSAVLDQIINHKKHVRSLKIELLVNSMLAY
jgi:phospholipid-translocating ATPase